MVKNNIAGILVLFVIRENIGENGGKIIFKSQENIAESICGNGIKNIPKS